MTATDLRLSHSHLGPRAVICAPRVTPSEREIRASWRSTIGFKSGGHWGPLHTLTVGHSGPWQEASPSPYQCRTSSYASLELEASGSTRPCPGSGSGEREVLCGHCPCTYLPHRENLLDVIQVDPIPIFQLPFSTPGPEKDKKALKGW